MISDHFKTRRVSLLTFPMHGQHQVPVTRVQIEQHGGPDQVLGEVTQQRNGPDGETTTC